jgi:putative transposase
MDQRVALIADWLRGEWSVTELAVRYGVVRKTVYKWIERYQADPEHGLAERSRAPHGHGRAMAADIRTAVLALRRQHPTWGPRSSGRCWNAATRRGRGRRPAPWAICCGGRA